MRVRHGEDGADEVEERHGQQEDGKHARPLQENYTLQWSGQ